MMNKATSSPGFMGLNNWINGPLSCYGSAAGNEEWAAPSVSAEDQSKDVGGGETSVFANSTLAVATAFGFVSGMSSQTASSGCLRATTGFASTGKLRECKPLQNGPHNQFELTRGATDTTAARKYPVENKPKDFVGCEISFPAEEYDSDDGTETSEITLYTNRMETMRDEFIKEMIKARMAAGGVAGHMNSKSAGLAFDPIKKSLYQSNSGSNLSPSSIGMGMGMARCTSASAMRVVNPRPNPSMSRLDETEEVHGEAPSRGNEDFMLQSQSSSCQETMKKSSAFTYTSKKSAGLAFDPNQLSRLPKNLFSFAKNTSAGGENSHNDSFTRRLEKVHEEKHEGNKRIGNGNEKSKDLQKKTTGFWMKRILQSESHTPDTVLSGKKKDPMFKSYMTNEKTSHECSSESPKYFESRSNSYYDMNYDDGFLSNQNSDREHSKKDVSWMQRLFEAEANPKSLLNRIRSDNDESTDEELLVANSSPDLKESKKDVSFMQRLLQDETNSSSFLTRQMGNSGKNYDGNLAQEYDYDESRKVVHNEEHGYSEEIFGNQDTIEDVDSNTKSTFKTTNSSLLNSIIELKMEFAQKQSLIDELSSKVNKHDKIVKDKDSTIQRLENQNEKLMAENELLRMQVAKLKIPSCNTLVSVGKTKE
mmetsp:Transcript_24794/g.51101  ORF Transcript_24794/g.51101 Transcript_24794/m.51101 type:complete len:649 (+) Transcript_24794:115-2061(+)